VEEVTSVLIEIDNLIKEIEDYRDASLEVNLKTYLESAIQFEVGCPMVLSKIKQDYLFVF
jgi:hypothetical protein